MEPKDRIIVSLDSITEQPKLIELVEKINHLVGYFSISHFWDVGLVVGWMMDRGFGGPERLMIDTKLYEIPDIAGLIAQRYSRLGVAMFTVAAASSYRTIDSVVKNRLTPSATILPYEKSLVFVTLIPTSFTEHECHFVHTAPAHIKALDFAFYAKLAGADGIVCSFKELEVINKVEKLKSLKKIVAGIRPTGNFDLFDQVNYVEPNKAIREGADYLLIGRPITQSKDPVTIIRRIIDEIPKTS